MASGQKRSLLKVGFLTLISLALLITTLVWLKGRGFSGGPADSVLFRDVDGLREGAPVQMMGIRVGFVDLVEPLQKDGRYYVSVKFNLNQNLNMNIPKGARLSIEQAGIIGEKFLEITPPQLQHVTLTTFNHDSNNAIAKGMPVKFLYEEGYLDVGQVEQVEHEDDGNLTRHTLYFRMTRPGAVMPANPLHELTMTPDGDYYLRVLPREPLLAHKPDPNLKYTIENPLRIKRFLEIQMDSANALKLTNDKINKLLSDETIDTLNSTLKNTEVLTARATEVMDSANELFQTTGRDLERLVSTSSDLAENVSAVSANLNDVIGDPRLKEDVISTMHSIEQSSQALNSILNDPALKETLSLTRETSRNASDIVSYLKQTAENKDLQKRLDTSIYLLNDSLGKLSVVLENIDDITNDDDETLKGILDDTRDTAKNMKNITAKFNKRFTLFRLMF